MVDALDDLIAAKRQERESLREKLAALDLELQTLVHAAELRPASRRVTHATENSAERIGHKGRQRGAISRQWRIILSRVAINYPDGANPDIIASFGRAVGLPNLRPTDAKQQAEKYVNRGYFEKIDDCYKVSDIARQKFKLETPDSSELSGAPRANGSVPSNP
jgi:hypothetical protein